MVYFPGNHQSGVSGLWLVRHSGPQMTQMMGEMVRNLSLNSGISPPPLSRPLWSSPSKMYIAPKYYKNSDLDPGFEEPGPPPPIHQVWDRVHGT